jgi:hypothetical protein
MQSHRPGLCAASSAPDKNIRKQNMIGSIEEADGSTDYSMAANLA